MSSPFKSIKQRIRFWFAAMSQRPVRKVESRFRLQLDTLDERTLLSVTPAIGDVFVIDMENHNLTQPNPASNPQQLLNNAAAPYLNSLMTPGSPNAEQTSYASKYYNVLYNNPGVSIHPSEPNYVWQEAGLNGPLNDNNPYPNNIVNAPNLSALLQAASISWKSYQEDIDMIPNSGTVNQPLGATLTSNVAPQSQWTVPLIGFSGTSAAYTNAYNGSHQYDFAAKHDGSLFFKATNGSTTTANFSPSNPEAPFYAPLQQFQTDLNSNTLARYTLITPNQFNDMHTALSGGFTYNGTHFTGDQAAIAQGDNFLAQIIPQITASQAYKNNGTIVIWFDETENGNTTSFTIPEIVISPLAKGNAYNSSLIYTHSSDLKSMQELFNVSAPGGGFLGDANTAGTNDIWDFYKFSPTITSTSGTAVAVGPTAPTLTDSAVLATGSNETGSLVFTLAGPNGFSYTQTVLVSGNGTYSASVALPTTAVPGTYQWSVNYAGDANNFGASDQGSTAEQTIVVGTGATVVGSVLYVVGGSGDDSLLVLSNSQNLMAFSPAGIGFFPASAISSIRIDGLGGNDQLFIGYGVFAPSILDGGSGNDSIINGGSARSFLIGGAGADFLIGGSNENILIGGSVAATDTQLTSWLNTWTGSASYEDRVAAISPLIRPNVNDDGNADSIYDLGGRDWYYLGVDDTVPFGIDSNEQVN